MDAFNRCPSQHILLILVCYCKKKDVFSNGEIINEAFFLFFFAKIKKQKSLEELAGQILFKYANINLKPSI